MMTLVEIMARSVGARPQQNKNCDVEYLLSVEALEQLIELVRADERKSRAHSLSPGEMELSLRRNHKDELFECRRRFSAEEVMRGPDFMVEATAMNLEAEMDRVIREWSNS